MLHLLLQKTLPEMYKRGRHQYAQGFFRGKFLMTRFMYLICIILNYIRQFWRNLYQMLHMRL